MDGKSVMGPLVTDGHHKPFGRRTSKDQELMVLTKFEVRLLSRHQDATSEDYYSGRVTTGKLR